MNTNATLILTVIAVGCTPAGDPGVTADTMAAAGSEMQGMADLDTASATAEMGGMQMGGDGPIQITARQAALAGITFAVAREAPVTRTVRAVAMVVPNERTLGIVNTRVSGWVEELHANETGMHVEAGEPLFELYAPDLVTAQEELLLAKRLARTAGGESLVTAARRRLVLWGISEQTIDEIEETGVVRRRLTIRSSYRGNVLEKHVIEGQMVRAGERLFKIADLSTVWIEPAVFEQDIPLVRERQRAEITFDAIPGRVFVGRVSFIYPTLDMSTRTLRIRVEIPNADRVIKPMMFGTVRVSTETPRGVTVPLTAVLPTGDRNLAFVFRDGRVWPTAVTISARGDSTILVSDGIAAGDTVVASATFLLDSESSLAAAMQGIMLNMGMGLDMGGMDMNEEGMEMDATADSSAMRGMVADSGRRP